MTTSLVSLFSQGENLKALSQSEIHYPETGARNLAEMEKHHFWFTSRRQVILRLLKSAFQDPRSSTPRVGLDIGCGTGFTAVTLTEQGWPTYGIDAHEGFADFRKAKRGAGFLRGDIFSIEPEPEFDFILLLDVIEHIEDDVRFLKQAMKFLKPNGVAIITVPAFSWLWSPIDDQSGHHRRYTKSDLKQRITQLGPSFDLEIQSYFYGFTLPPFMISRLQNKANNAVIQTEAVPPKILNLAFKGILNIEQLFLPLGGMPVGSSLFARIRKN